MGYITTKYLVKSKTNCFTVVEMLSKGVRDSLFKSKTSCFTVRENCGALTANNLIVS